MSLLVIVAIALVSAGIGIYLIRSARQRLGSEPRCGQCGYNLTGSMSDRCPECGLRFIEAGIVKGSPTSRARLRVGLALIILVPALCSLSATTYMARRAAVQRASAQTTQQFLNQMLGPSGQPSAANGRSSGE